MDQLVPPGGAGLMVPLHQQQSLASHQMVPAVFTTASRTSQNLQRLFKLENENVCFRGFNYY